MHVPRINEAENFVPCRIKLCFDDQDASIGTAFHYRHKGKQYLVTNWHNVTGRKPISHEALSPTTLLLPNVVKIGLPMRSSDDGQKVALGWSDHAVRLYEDADNLKAKWFEHPVHMDKVDVVVLEVSGVENTALRFVNEVCDKDQSPRLRAGMDVFTLGYPRGITGGGRFPIWKRGSIATEPDVDIDGLPLLYIDSATREGMSGAPVFASEGGAWWPEGKSSEKDMILGLGRRFLGIYSGRVGDDSFLAQLGKVWKEKAIIEIIEGGRLGISAFKL